ncbi:MAG: DUF4869 domain-containing protein [Lachnospiraceae bacterium]|nr:DUF4869 domain-containing protein [Lachnospiraceae bacterium]
MLKIDYGRPDFCIDNADLEFEEEFEYSWLKDEFNVRILEEVEHALLNGNILYDMTEIDRTFGIYDISSGSKALMLTHELEEPMVWGPLFGDNCAGLLLEIAEKKDVVIYLKNIINFPEERFRAYSFRLGREYTDYREYELDAVMGVTECMFL